MYKLLLPRLGQTMAEGVMGQWLVDSGEEFAVGTHLYEVETEKVTTSVEANQAGRIVRLLAEEGATIEVGAVLAIIASAAETPTETEIDVFLGDGAFEMEASSSADAAAEAETAAEIPARTFAEPQAAGPVAALLGGSGQPVRAMPRTRALASGLGVAVSDVPGSGRHGLITERDVREFSATAKRPAEAASAAAIPTQPELVPLPSDVAIRERRRLNGIGRAMAAGTARSWAQVPTFTQSLQIRAPRWREARDRLRDETGTAIGYNDMVIESTVRALAAVPEVNASFDGDAVVLWDEVNITIAVDSPSGLVIPVLKGAERMDIAERASAVAAIVERARSGALMPEDMSGGTITVSNLGMFGIEGGFPMVTAPQAAIVFIGAMEERVLAADGAIAVIPAFSVTSAFDHRALDGATAAGFSVALKKELEGWR